MNAGNGSGRCLSLLSEVSNNIVDSSIFSDCKLD